MKDGIHKDSFYFYPDRIELPYVRVQGQIAEITLPAQKTKIKIDNLDCLGIFKARLKKQKKILNES